jgi:hypothetical protein
VEVGEGTITRIHDYAGCQYRDEARIRGHDDVIHFTHNLKENYTILVAYYSLISITTRIGWIIVSDISHMC